MIKELVTDVEKLSERAQEWNVKEEINGKVVEILQALGDTLEDLNTKDGRLFLTANQIGYTERAFAIKFEDDIKYFFNPIIKGRKGLVFSREKDFLTGTDYIVPRSTEIILNYQDSLGRVKGNKFEGAAAIVASGAIDSLEGLLISDWGLEITPEFDVASEEEQKEVLAYYIQSLNAYRDALDKDLSEGENKEEYKAIKFMEGVANGTVELEKEKEPKMNRAQRRGLDKTIKRIANSLKHSKKRRK